MATSLLAELADQVAEGNDLDRATASRAARTLTDASEPGEVSQRFLSALAKKGETADEVAGFAEAFRELARDPGLGEIAPQAVDLVGTGGDGAGSFNISTTAAMLVAAMGQPVIKHGNRSITSQCGSADFLELLGVPLEPSLDRLKAGLRELNFAFLFAPAWHPAFKAIMPVRQALAAEGQRTIFNLLGPLINPARPAYQLLGVFSGSWVGPLAEALDQLGLKAAAVGHCTLGNGQAMDELTTAGENVLAGAGELRGMELSLGATHVGVDPGNPAELKGGDAARNLALLQALLDGSAPGTLEDTVCLNAGTAWWVCGRCPSIQAGFMAAREALARGVLRAWLERLRAFFAA